MKWMASVKRQKLMGLFFLGLILFNFPIIALFSEAGWFFNLPVLYVYIFLAWILIILSTALILRSKSGQLDNNLQEEPKDFEDS
ncbi:MAG: hypothetical protein AAFO07_00780 [Bacteroidota bacterium]